GRPFPGAMVSLILLQSQDRVSRPVASVQADAGGQFRLAYLRPHSGSRAPGELLVVSARGFGPGWLSSADADFTQPVTLRLVQDDVPIEGRVLDLEGNPVKGVTITVETIYAARDDDFAAWLETVQAGQPSYNSFRLLRSELEPGAGGIA